MLWTAIPGMMPTVEHPPPAAAPTPAAVPLKAALPWTAPGYVLPLRLASGDRTEPGFVFLTRPHEGRECPYWDNCDGAHVTVILPNAVWWDVMSRASNCDMRGDRTHRCWVLHGSLDQLSELTVDKKGDTCGAGQGSILSGDFHGFLRGGELVV